MIEELRQNLRERLAAHKAPFHAADRDAAADAIERLQSTDPAHWAEVWSAAAEPFRARGEAFAAYGLYHVARFPTPNHPAKLAAYRRSVEAYREAGRGFDPPVEAIDVPFAGRAGEGDRVVFYVRRRATATPQPVLIRWGGIDTWKEDRHDINEAAIAAGFACVNVDMPGVGESPVLGSVDAERQFVPVLDWIASQPDLDARRVVAIGMSYGGYWATKLAHRFPERFVGVVNWGGGIDRFFTREWIERSRGARSYLFDLAGARARTVGAADYDGYIAAVAGFSLREQGVLDRPHAPMLVVNGRDDEQVPLDDLLLLCEHGAPKALRLFPGGHMGYGPQTLPTVLAWAQAMAV